MRAPDSPEDALRIAAEAGRGRLMERLGIRYTTITPELVVARMPVEGNTQIYGVLHGGATAALCESVGSMGTALIVGPERVALGVELNVNHLHAVSDGWVEATGKPLHIGGTTAVWQVEVRDDSGRLTAVSRLTLVLKESR